MKDIIYLTILNQPGQFITFEIWGIKQWMCSFHRSIQHEQFLTPAVRKEQIGKTKGCLWLATAFFYFVSATLATIKGLLVIIYDFWWLYVTLSNTSSSWSLIHLTLNDGCCHSCTGKASGSMKSNHPLWKQAVHIMFLKIMKKGSAPRKRVASKTW